MDEYSAHLGGLLANFQSLEFILRSYLQKHSVPKPLETTTYGDSFYNYPVGTELPENAITNFDTLGALIDKFNVQMNQKGLVKIDRSLIDIRDALAHGRASSFEITDQMHLIKFSRPVKGKVKIVFNEALTRKWFTINKRRVLEAIKLVHSNY